MIQDNENEGLTAMINMALSTDDIKKFLRLCHIIFLSKDRKDLALKTKKYMKDPVLNREIGLLNSIKENVDNKVLYYGDDKGLTDPLRYRIDIEEKISNIELEMLELLGKMIKESQFEGISITGIK